MVENADMILSFQIDHKIITARVKLFALELALCYDVDGVNYEVFTDSYCNFGHAPVVNYHVSCIMLNIFTCTYVNIIGCLNCFPNV